MIEVPLNPNHPFSSSQTTPGIPLIPESCGLHELSWERPCLNFCVSMYVVRSARSIRTSLPIRTAGNSPRQTSRRTCQADTPRTLEASSTESNRDSDVDLAAARFILHIRSLDFSVHPQRCGARATPVPARRARERDGNAYKSEATRNREVGSQFLRIALRGYLLDPASRNLFFTK